MKRATGLALTVILIAFGLNIGQRALAADPTPSPTPGASASPASSPAASPLVPNYRDPEIPQIQSLSTSANKAGETFTLSAELTVKIHSNTLNSIEIVLLPKTNSSAANPKLIPPCVKLGSIKSAATKIGSDMPSLQSRSAANGYYLERHIIIFTTRLPLVQYATDKPTYQDICDGQYLISSIVLKDAASHVLTLTANASSTAPLQVASTTGTGTTNTSGNKAKYTDASIMQADFWVDSSPMPCQQSSNLAPTQISTVVNGKTVQTIGVPPTSPTIRNTCNQTLDFKKIYLTVGADSANSTVATGTSTMPIVDYVAQAKTLASENSRIKNQMDILNRQIASLQNSVNILRGGGKLPVDTATATGDTIDFKALASTLQKQVDALKKQLASSSSKAKSKVTSKPKAAASSSSSSKVSPAPTWRPSSKASPVPTWKATSPSSRGPSWTPGQSNGNWKSTHNGSGSGTSSSSSN